jgi:peptidoglycan/LPS O-acetylase OafA/YrhL
MRADRYTYLDLVRGLSAFAVLIVHYRWFYAQGVGDFTSALAHPLPFSTVLGPIYAHGGLAVQAFWMLSGVIFFIKYGGHGERIDVRKFAVWRFARLYPLHLATLLLVALIQFFSISRFGAPKIYGHNDAWHFVMHLFMASNWINATDESFNAPIWSVSIEVLIYALFVVYVRFGKPALWKTASAFLVMTIADHLLLNMILLCGALFFLGGAIVQALQLGRPILRRWMAPACYLTVIAALGLAAAASSHTSASLFVAIPAVMLLALTLDNAAPPVPKAAGWIGEITYSTYLMHMPILMVAKMWLDQRADRFIILDSRAMLFAWIGTVIVIGLVVHRLFELPAQRWLQDRFHAGRARNSIEREEMRTI